MWTLSFVGSPPPLENRKIRERGGEKNLTVEVTFDRTPETTSPSTASPVQHPKPPRDLNKEENLHQQQEDAASSSASGWGDVPPATRSGGAWEEEEEPSPEAATTATPTASHTAAATGAQEMLQRQQAADDWKNTPNIGDWSEEVSKEMPSPQAVMQPGE